MSELPPADGADDRQAVPPMSAVGLDVTALLEQVDQGIIVADDDGRLILVNDVAARMHGVRQRDVEPADYAERYHLFTLSGVPYPPHDLPLARAVRGERVEGAPWRIHRGDGTILAVIGDARPLRDAGEIQTGAALTIRDETAWVDTEAALKLSEEQFRLATGASGVGTRDLDLTTDVLTWTDRTKAMFGISPGVSCSMQDFYDGLHPDDRADVTVAFADAIDPATRAQYDVLYRTIGKEDGLLRWVAARGRGIFDGEGRCIRAIGTVLDMTNEQQAARLQAALNDLDERLRVAGSAPICRARPPSCWGQRSASRGRAMARSTPPPGR